MGSSGRQDHVTCSELEPLRRQKVLIVDQNSSSCVRHQCGYVLGRLQSVLPEECSQPELDGAVSDHRPVPDVVVLRPAGGRSAAQLIQSCKERWRRAPVLALLCCRRDSPLDAFSLVLNAADDFVFCPFQLGEVCLRLKRLLFGKGGAPAGREYVPPDYDLYLGALVGKSDKFLQAVGKIPPIARSDATVLLSGETGTGKELFARAIHYHGARQGKPFIPVNCGALPDHLFENELFGHAKGAFTDASSAQTGLIAEAEGGTLFLDEIDALSAAAQVKLLRFLQDGEFRPLGSSRTIKSDVRILAATNADLRSRVEQKLFREDLYHRLNVLSLTVPSLRERLGDVPILATHFLTRYCKQYGHPAASFSAGALRRLLSYPWPGNVRELEAVVQRSVVLNPLAIIEPEQIELPSAADEAGARNESLREAKSTAVSVFERNYLAALLASHRGNVTQAAKAAGKDRRTFQRLLRKYHIVRSAFQ